MKTKNKHRNTKAQIQRHLTDMIAMTQDLDEKHLYNPIVLFLLRNAKRYLEQSSWSDEQVKAQLDNINSSGDDSDKNKQD